MAMGLDIASIISDLYTTLQTSNVTLSRLFSLRQEFSGEAICRLSLPFMAAIDTPDTRLRYGTSTPDKASSLSRPKHWKVKVCCRMEP
jgi:hypothetical protein